ncbi:hypothetical protein [Immundisolibacter cernigliae]|uniref:Uncharacterized protein n=1 Tax=Immundisolibacter cernigliae TaxID=1810504 RepID=A0A1B1YVL2_9GAMM|nr:hypothetical protein [Immundisolibacter cernigliae]ANX04728.1 hypothetical protein PG2T_11495 [Immundisolibacter cernigliae]
MAAKFAALAAGQPEDQLCGPTERLLTAMGTMEGLVVAAKDESLLPDQSGRPHSAVTVGAMLCGYVEQEAPGTGVAVGRYTGHNRQQWQRSTPRLDNGDAPRAGCLQITPSSGPAMTPGHTMPPTPTRSQSCSRNRRKSRCLVLSVLSR